MVTIWHQLMAYIWAVLAVVGVLLGALLWVVMAVWDGIRGAFRRLSGEVDDGRTPRCATQAPSWWTAPMASIRSSPRPDRARRSGDCLGLRRLSRSIELVRSP